MKKANFENITRLRTFGLVVCNERLNQLRFRRRAQWRSQSIFGCGPTKINRDNQSPHRSTPRLRSTCRAATAACVAAFRLLEACPSANRSPLMSTAMR